jgi:hypothetical protein
MYAQRNTEALFRYHFFFVENQEGLHPPNVCSLSYPACKAHVPYCHLWLARLYCTIFSTLSHKRHDFIKKKSY